MPSVSLVGVHITMSGKMHFLEGEMSQCAAISINKPDVFVQNLILIIRCGLHSGNGQTAKLLSAQSCPWQKQEGAPIMTE